MYRFDKNNSTRYIVIVKKCYFNFNKIIKYLICYLKLIRWQHFIFQYYNQLYFTTVDVTIKQFGCKKKGLRLKIVYAVIHTCSKI